jgi:hypothetical protein
MLLSTLYSLLAASLLAQTTSAHPSPVDLVRRACSTLGPSLIDVLQAADPNSPSVTGDFRLDRTDSVNEVLTALTFNYIPPGATGCTLHVTFPPHDPGTIASGTTTQANVYLASPDPYGTSTWNNRPQTEQMVATVIFPTEGSTDTYETNLWAGTCPFGPTQNGGTLTFLFELSNWQQGSGSVNFYNSLGGKGFEAVGFSLIFDC